MEQANGLRQGTITAIAPLPRQRSRVAIFLDDEFAFGLDAELVRRHGLKKGVVLPVAVQEQLLLDEELRNALNRAFRLLGQHSRSEQELRQKLEAWRFHATVVERTVARCRDLGYLDDAQFARDFARTQLNRRPQGMARVRVAMLHKGIAANIADQALSEVFAPGASAALAEKAAEKFLKRHAGQVPPDTLRRRLADHLLRAGFSWEEIQSLPAWQKFSNEQDVRA